MTRPPRILHGPNVAAWRACGCPRFAGGDTGAVTPLVVNAQPGLRAPIASVPLTASLTLSTTPQALSAPISIWIGANAQALVTLSQIINLAAADKETVTVIVNGTPALVVIEASNPAAAGAYVTPTGAMVATLANAGVVANAINTFTTSAVILGATSSSVLGAFTVQPL
jgi:hypothetical protein